MYGSISLILWTLILLCCVKYVFIILSADSEGEGGTFALLALLLGDKHKHKKKQTWVLVATITSIIGNPFFQSCTHIQAGAMVMSDGVLTPAISILSAMEGLTIIKPSLKPAVVPICVVILIVLFLVQRFGSAKIGTVFAPVMCIWFAAISAIGIYNLIQAPRILAAFNPAEAVMFLARRNTEDALLMMGGIFLTVTGGEALYADIGTIFPPLAKIYVYSRSFWSKSNSIWMVCICDACIGIKLSWPRSYAVTRTNSCNQPFL